MKRRDIIIFFSIVFSVYGLINFYILYRGWNGFAFLPELRSYALPLFIVIAAAYPLGRMLERFTLSLFSEIIVYIGSMWLGMMMYLFLLTGAVDILRLFNYFIHFFPSIITEHTVETNFWTASFVFGLSALITLYGFINAKYPRVKKLEFVVPAKNSTLKELRIAVVSDIHLGTIMGKKRLNYIVSKINSLNPDLVLFPGDVFDEDIGRVIKNNLGDILKSITSQHGVFAVTGNHEYFGGVEQAVKYLRDHGITVLRDQAIDVTHAITVIGREDISYNRWNGQKRKSLNEILNASENHLPTIVLDHQPFNLHESAEAGIDVQLSGHTHHGQLFPFNYITNRMYEVSWGYKKKEQTHIYVSCGVGSWGPPIRTGNTPEILDITIRFE